MHNYNFKNHFLWLESVSYDFFYVILVAVVFLLRAFSSIQFEDILFLFGLIFTAEFAQRERRINHNEKLKRLRIFIESASGALEREKEFEELIRRREEERRLIKKPSYSYPNSQEYLEAEKKIQSKVIYYTCYLKALNQGLVDDKDANIHNIPIYVFFFLKRQPKSTPPLVPQDSLMTKTFT